MLVLVHGDGGQLASARGPATTLFIVITVGKVKAEYELPQLLGGKRVFTGHARQDAVVFVFVGVRVW